MDSFGVGFGEVGAESPAGLGFGVQNVEVCGVGFRERLENHRIHPRDPEAPRRSSVPGFGVLELCLGIFRWGFGTEGT